jgi:hypothetical protein
MLTIEGKDGAWDGLALWWWTSGPRGGCAEPSMGSLAGGLMWKFKGTGKRVRVRSQSTAGTGAERYRNGLSTRQSCPFFPIPNTANSHPPQPPPSVETSNRIQHSPIAGRNAPHALAPNGPTAQPYDARLAIRFCPRCAAQLAWGARSWYGSRADWDGGGIDQGGGPNEGMG